MDRKQTRGDASSRFHFQRVTTHTRNVTLVDTGCQRCQHCTLQRWRMQVPVTTEKDSTNPGMKPEETPCRQ